MFPFDGSKEGSGPWATAIPYAVGSCGMTNALPSLIHQGW